MLNIIKTQIKLIGDIVDLDPLAKYEVDPDPTYADADFEVGVLVYYLRSRATP
jgi:hypothetical protein